MVLGIILLVALGLLLLWFARILYLTWAQRNVSISVSDELPLAPEEAAAHVIGQITPTMQAWDYRLTNQGPTTIQFSYAYRSAWLVFPCVLFFPIGLLSLLYKKTVDMVFNFAPVEGGTLVTATGRGPKHMRTGISAALERLGEGGSKGCLRR